MLYADLAGSTQLSMVLLPTVVAEITKSFLTAACRVIRHHGGHIRSFDGDRVMGVFVGPGMQDRAVSAALELHWFVREYIRPLYLAKYPAIGGLGLDIAHGVGIDTSDVLVAKTGIRRNNDLVWIGRAPNIAAKLAAIRIDDARTFITGAVFLALDRTIRVSGLSDNPPLSEMWDAHPWSDAPAAWSGPIFSSSWWHRRALTE
jgi:class 3 adenylate cyclase